ncbi:aldose epimerase family protein [Nonomuraea sp. NPDC050786]|uniref:aldose epimerase family protein n=1 Tax=Nonomuraea sp. NPDC050786 TaxID=3154840 RepID=UPI0033F6F108
MRVSRQPAGTTSGHEGQPPTPVDAYKLDTEAGLSITVWTYGATLVDVRLTTESTGPSDNLVLRLKDLAAYEHRAGNPYIGSTVGRFCRKVDSGRLVLDGHVHQLDLNDYGSHIHGGELGFDRYVWQAEVVEEPDQLALHLSLTSPHGDQGYPGEVKAETIYRVDSANRLTLEHRATTTSPTIVGMTNHSYWNLAGSGTIDGQELHVNASRFLEFVDELPVPGPPAPTAGTPLDFTSPRKLADCHVDNFFILDDSSFAAELYDSGSGRRMRVTTDQPGLAVFTADPPHLFSVPRTGLTLQASAFPDAPNRPDFPSARLDPGQIYVSRTVHEFLS